MMSLNHLAYSFLLRNPCIIIIVTCAIVYAPFSTKPFFMDSPVTVYMAQQLLVSPVDPPLGRYGELLSPWNHTDLPAASAYYATPHPPLVPLYLAPFVAVFGANEIVLNWAMFPFYALSVLFFFGFMSLLWPMHKRGATALFALCPVVFVNAQDVMLDVPLMAFTLGAFFYMLRSRGPADAVISGVFAALACLTKFTGGTVVVSGIVLFVLSKKWKECGLFLLPFTALYGAWILHNLLLWGNIQLLANGHARYCIGDIRYRMERLMSYFGGTVVVPIFPLVLAFCNKKFRLPALMASAAAGVWAFLLWDRLHYSAWSALVYALCASAGIVLFYCVGILIAMRPAPQRAALGVHVLAQIAGGLFLTSYASRYLLPVAFLGVPAFLLLLDDLKGPAANRVTRVSAVFCGAILSILLSVSGGQWAKADRDAAHDIALLASGRNVFYSGRLGYLYYFDKSGAKSLLLSGKRPQTGDILVKNTVCKDDAGFFGDTSGLEFVKQLRYPLFPLRGTSGRAGFYGDDRLPCAWVTVPAGRVFTVYRKK
jgi:Dolichyl-phosphate-mannose-protein mannosyltransferase